MNHLHHNLQEEMMIQAAEEEIQTLVKLLLPILIQLLMAVHILKLFIRLKKN
jgi:hypothetical protein